MPTVKIELLEGRDRETLIKLKNSVMDSVVEVLKLPHNDRNIRILEYPSHLFDMKPPNEVLIEITMFLGRTRQTKKKLYEKIVDDLESNDIVGREKILIIVNEPPLENWGVRGGKSADEIDLGFNVNI